MVAENRNQETEGLFSPLLRSVRLRKAARLILPGSLVLDIACGGGDLKEFLPPGCRYFGVDRIIPPPTANFDVFLAGDVMSPEFLGKLKPWLPGRADVITMLAFIEHIEFPGTILHALAEVLAENGRIILTTPHPSGRSLHDRLARFGLCSSSAAEEHEQFFDRSDLEKIARQAGFFTVNYQRFLFGLNQIVEITPAPSAPATPSVATA